MKKTLIALATVALLPVVAACSGAPEPVGTTATSASAESDFLAQHNLDGRSVREIVASLDATNDDREAGPYGSVRPGELVLSDDTGAEVTLPVDEGFYLSVAPYLTQTHECYNHNLASCQGELAGEEIEVSIVTAEGEQLVDETVTTYDNGFVGFWLPAGIQATITVGQDGKSATQEISTGIEDPTCITTMQLV
ncbi:CueP family metal-binding protein [Tessaracoccus sp. MC1865]|uniref:CueP family metal-binding protein n=1 Tax=Tessaracoccus sp. MC1865 TaxID=2760310 RepID=UPI00160312FB|nr:CueP family metal-binding protein [Tessaracoccus sp. MC1865]MBB1483609.1 CueP family metal-binding protein [Tessaracoccus sp. MC1865]QTO36688.1 CueP family metal-binding protein [Tessaracoccus sp. MC1865]